MSSDTEDLPYAGRPTVAQLEELLQSLVRWQQFGIHLPGITDVTINEIERDRPGNNELQKMDLFSKWLQVDPSASWKDVIVALKKANEHTLASIIGEVTNTTVPGNCITSNYISLLHWPLQLQCLSMKVKLSQVHI